MVLTGDMHNRQAITPRRLWSALKDYDLWPVSLHFPIPNIFLTLPEIYALGLVCFIPESPPTTYLTLNLRQLGFSTVRCLIALHITS